MSQGGAAGALQRPILMQSRHVSGRQALCSSTASITSVFDFA
jgi:hypothetical protein